MENEKFLEEYPIPVSLEKTETIINQMKSSVCKIYAEDGSKGTGFFCKIPKDISDKKPSKDNFIKTLITNYHVVNEKQKTINISINNDDQYISNIENKVLYKDEMADIIIIDIKSQKEIDNFLELDLSIFKKGEENYKNESIYILNYPGGNDIVVSYGTIKNVEESNIKHLCCTDKGSSGSPIINLKNNKIIGIHKQSHKTNNYNIGLLLKEPIKELLNKNYILDLKNKNLGNDGIKNLVNYSNIKELDLSENNISDIKVLERVKFEKLEKLDLRRNKISNIEILKIVNFRELKELDLSRNYISDIKVLERV